MIHTISKYLNVTTPTQMWDLCHTIYHHSEYQTEYEEVYRQKFDEIRYKYEDDVFIDSWLIEGFLVQKQNLTLVELSIDFHPTWNKNFDTTEIREELSELLDDVIDYIIANSNVEVYADDTDK